MLQLAPASHVLVQRGSLLRRVANVVRGRPREHVGLGRLRHTVQPLHKSAHRVSVHRVTAREGLQLLIWFLHPVAAHHRLNRLRQHLPAPVQVLLQRGPVDLQLAHPLERALVRQQTVRQPHAQVAQDGGVGKVALPAADGQLVRQVLHHRIGHATVSLAVLKVDGVYLVRHRTAAHLARDGALLKVAQTDVAPDVAVKVDEDVVEADYGGEELRDVIVRLDLGDVGVPCEAEPNHKLFAHRAPVDVGVGADVGVPVAHRSRDFAHVLLTRHLLALPLQTIRHVGELLPHGGGAGGLAVGAAEHGHVRELLRHGRQLSDDLLHHRQHLPRHRLAKLQRVAQVVDVLRGACKVGKLQHFAQLLIRRKLILQHVLHRLHVMVGGPLHILHRLRILYTPVVGEVVEKGVRGVAEGRYLLHLR
mmetsp:Transcript_5301/g.9543  ORF Transcript_5301/g.9543 Transcript_5301/m.9543 type:complete len:419 (-) Transcript_5301:580-1836(-)